MTRRTYTPQQKAFLQKLIVDEKCIADQVSELTGIPLGTASTMARKHGASAQKSRLSALDRVKMARQTADLRLKHFQTIKNLFG